EDTGLRGEPPATSGSPRGRETGFQGGRGCWNSMRRRRAEREGRGGGVLSRDPYLLGAVEAANEDLVAGQRLHKRKRLRVGPGGPGGGRPPPRPSRKTSRRGWPK